MFHRPRDFTLQSCLNRQQLQDAKSQRAENEIEVPDQIAESAGPWNHRIALRVEQAHGAFLLGRAGNLFAVRAELAHEGRVQRVGAHRIRRLDLEHGVVARRPGRFVAPLRKKELASLTQGLLLRGGLSLHQHLLGLDLLHHVGRTPKA